MKNEKVACIVFLVSALLISLVLSGLPFLVSYSESSLHNIEGLKVAGKKIQNLAQITLAQTTPYLTTPAPTENATMSEAREKYKMLDNAITNIANYAITQSGKEQEVLIEKNIIMNGANEIMNIIQTGKTTNGVDANYQTLIDIYLPATKSLSKIFSYIIKYPDDDDSLLKMGSAQYIHEDLAFLALKRVDPQLWEKKMRGG